MMIMPLGICAPNLKGMPTSCYITYIGRTLIVIDTGIGIQWQDYIDFNNVDNVVIIVTHLHCDHVNGLIKFPCLKPTKVYISFGGKKSMTLRKLLCSKFNFYDLNENLKFSIGKYVFSFCKTNHCIETYAVKIQKENDIFVYTSDIESIDEKLSTFCKMATTVIVDSGNPINKLHLKGYHGNTTEIVTSLKECGVDSIFLSHLKPQLLNWYNYIAFEIYCNVIKRSESIDVFNSDCVYNLETQLGEKVAS